MSVLRICDVCKDPCEDDYQGALATREVVVKGLRLEVKTSVKVLDTLEGSFDICEDCMPLAIAAEEAPKAE